MDYQKNKGTGHRTIVKHFPPLSILVVSNVFQQRHNIFKQIRFLIDDGISFFQNYVSSFYFELTADTEDTILVCTCSIKTEVPQTNKKITQINRGKK